MAGSMTQKIYESLRSEYNRAENELKSVDKNLKKLTGGTEHFIEKGSSISSRSKSGRGFFDDKRYTSNRSSDMNRKRRLSPPSSRIFSRLDKRLDSDVDRKRPSLQSAIVSTVQGNDAVKVKEENVVKEDKASDKKSVARNRRMFGMIMGTLEKFQNEETQRKVVTSKKEIIEKKLDQADAEEKEAVKQEKLSLIKSKRDKQTQLKDIETKMDRVEIHQQWEKSNQHLANFIQTKTKPHIFYMPNKMTPETEKRLKETKNKYLIILAEKRAKIQKEIEDLNKKEEEMRNGAKAKNENGLKNSDLNEKRVSKEMKEESTELKNGLIKNEDSRSNGQDDIELKENKRMKTVQDDSEDGECNSSDARQLDNLKNVIVQEKSDDRSNDEKNKSSDSIKMDEESNEMNCEAHPTDRHERTNEVQDGNSNLTQRKVAEKVLDDKDFEPIYDE